MSTRIMILCGSPRERGNTNRLVSWFEKSAKAAGAEVEVVDTTDLQYKNTGCVACMKCWKSEQFACAVQDEAQPILNRIPETDVLVMATPVYWFGPSAQLKTFTDRMFCLIKGDRKTGGFKHIMSGKSMALLATAGNDEDSGLNLVELTYRTMARFLEMPYHSILVPKSPMRPHDIEKDLALKGRVEALARRLARKDMIARAV